MSLPTILACLALLGSLVMVFQHRPLPLPVVALAASGFEVLSAFGVIHVSFGRLPMGLLLGVALVIAGAGVYFKTAAKSVVSAATAVMLVGAIQTLLHLQR